VAAADSPKPAVADPPKPAVVDPPKHVADPPKPAVVDPPKHAADPPKTASAKPTPPKPDLARPAARPADTAAKSISKKPADAKKPSDTKHTAAPERVARASPKAQPIDPYGAPDKPRADPAVAYKAGLQQYARGDTSGALATFRGSLSSNPGFAPTWRGLGLVYEKLGNKGQARSSFKRYLQLAPGASDADQIRDRLERLGS
jgi:tetratricopeptide (TPR) repeat protein